jgi:hypothetical protein
MLSLSKCLDLCITALVLERFGVGNGEMLVIFVIPNNHTPALRRCLDYALCWAVVLTRRGLCFV